MLTPTEIAARAIATEVVMPAFDPGPGGDVIKFIEKLDLDARKTSAVLALRISIAAIISLWPDEDREAVFRADEKYLDDQATMKPIFDIARDDSPTTAYVRDRAVRAAPMLCPHCLRGLRAYDVELRDGDVHAICGSCHHDLLTIERA